jgi:hypothetical protein
VINIAGCPPHPDWITETLALLAHGQLGGSDLDDYGRPRFYADQLVHHGCPRNEYYEFKASAAKHSDQGCLMEQLGCKGTQAHADCNQRLWNGEGSCLRGGFACICCTDPGFRGAGSPLRKHAEGGRHSHRPAFRHAQGLVHRAGRPVKVGDPGARARERHGRSSEAYAPRQAWPQMTTRRVLGPFNRVEGDLEITLDIEAGRVSAAYVNSPLYRGFEQILQGKMPADALTLVPRICGICSVAQSAPRRWPWPMQRRSSRRRTAAWRPI